jgi:hypothetical protein
VKDAVHSPAIDAGSAGSPFASETSPNGGKANIGVYGGTLEASQTDIENSPPEDIFLIPNQILENQIFGSLIGQLSVIDANPEDLHDLGLVDGDGSLDNELFDLRNHQLFTRAEFDFEHRSTYSVRIQARDRRGGIYAKTILIHINDVEEGNFIRQRFQLGTNAYTEVRDTFVSTDEWETPPQYSRNYGQSEELIVSRDGGNNGLIRFDLSQIPSNSVISEARLELYNTTPSSVSGSVAPIRRITAHAVWSEWMEGNLMGTPLVSSDVGGSTGDFAAFFANDSSLNRTWGIRGMMEGEDFNSSPVDTAEVLGEGWYGWNVLGLVQSWIAGRESNFGITLRDATGYDEQQDDSRVFYSSQFQEQAELRPRLLVVYNPLTQCH